MAATSSVRTGLAENIVNHPGGIGYTQFVDAGIAGLSQIKADLEKFSTENKTMASALEKVEKDVGLTRDKVAIAIAGIVSLYLAFGAEACLVCNVFIGTVYPAFASLLAYYNQDSSQDIHWLSYWTIFGGLLFFDSILFDVPAYYLGKAIVLLALMLPQIRGSDILYEEALKRGLLEPFADRESKNEQANSARNEPAKSERKEPSARNELAQSNEKGKATSNENISTAREPLKSAREQILTARESVNSTSEPSKSRRKSIRFSAKPLAPADRVMLNEWDDFRVGDPFPTEGSYIKALFRSLDTLPGEDKDQYIALYYKMGEPIFGRVWNQDGKIAANFGWFGNEYRNQVGSKIYLLVDLPENVRGFDYAWKAFPEAAAFEPSKEWIPVHVDHYKGNISPGVLIVDEKEILGKVDVRNERASYGYGGSEKVVVGPAVHTTQVLCRKARPGCKFD